MTTEIKEKTILATKLFSALFDFINTVVDLPGCYLLANGNQFTLLLRTAKLSLGLFDFIIKFMPVAFENYYLIHFRRGTWTLDFLNALGAESLKEMNIGSFS